MIKKTIGGDRIGSGRKMETTLPNFGRSNQNLTQSCKTTMAPGVLYPFLKIICTNGDSFDINLDAIVRTIPTKAPLFGSFKLQIDVYQAPIRLYQGILHNNPIDIGLSMENVKLPQLRFLTNGDKNANQITPNLDEQQVANNALVKYLGISGAGYYDSSVEFDPEDNAIMRDFNAVPILAYYDIFKNYYANKQEKNAYVITPKIYSNTPIMATLDDEEVQTQTNIEIEAGIEHTITGTGLSPKAIAIKKVWLRGNETTENLQTLAIQGNANILIDTGTEIKFKLLNEWAMNTRRTTSLSIVSVTTEPTDIQLQPFELKAIDRMRNELLKANEPGETFYIDQNSELPYLTCADTANSDNISNNAFKMNGLVVKTYQSDLFNNWLNTEFITGTNGIAEITAVDTSDGYLNLDALNLSQKVYNMLNRIAISGGTYQDWQEAVYTEKAVRHCETPMYLGGMSSEVVFEEVISTATTGDNEASKLGSLAGKGRLLGKKGGNIKVKITEPSYIIGIVSLTPRIDYCQGNDFDMTEIQTLNDLHKPDLDEIGFQNLITEQMAWWDTHLDNNQNPIKKSAGKVPAWINYMTAVDKVYGDFANNDEAGFMVLKRDYDVDDNMQIKDLTTYIEPQKFNYAFAYTNLDSQNFWCQIVSQITARRKMSSKIIPNL